MDEIHLYHSFFMHNILNHSLLFIFHPWCAIMKIFKKISWTMSYMKIFTEVLFELGLNIVTNRDSSFIIFDLFNTKYNLVLKPYSFVSCFQLFHILNKILFVHFFGHSFCDLVLGCFAMRSWFRFSFIFVIDCPNISCIVNFFWPW
jgi:hypothetical protein